jgi:putative transposase
MKTGITKATAEAAEGTLFLGDDWFDPLEAGVRTRIRGFIEELLEAELDAALGRDRYERPRLAGKDAAARQAAVAGYRHGHRERGLMGTFGAVTVRVPRGRNPAWQDGRVEERDHSGLPAAHQTGRRADRRRLFCRDQHAPCAPGARGFVRRRRGEGHG